MRSVLSIFIMLHIMIYAGEHRLLLTGFTKHETSNQPNGQSWNEENYGAGYEYTSFTKYDQLYYSSNITILEDSFNFKQYTLSTAPTIRYKLSQNRSFSIGLAFFLMAKRETYLKNYSSIKPDYGIIPGAAPLAIFTYKKMTLNFAYVPTVSVGNIESIGFGIVYFGWTL